MQLSGVPVPRIWVEATSYTDHSSTAKPGARFMSGQSRSARFSTTATFLLAFVVLLSQVVCQGAVANPHSTSNVTDISSAVHKKPPSILALGYRDDSADSDPNRGIMYDPPWRAPGLTDEEFNETWRGEPYTLKIGVLMPFTPVKGKAYTTTMSRINLSVLRMAVRDMNNQQVIPGMNVSLVLRDSQRPIPHTNVSGGASAITATTRLLSMDIAGVIGDVSSDLTAAEALMTSSVGVPQCAFSSYNLDMEHLGDFPYLFRTAPTVLAFVQSLAYVVDHYGWKRISVLHTSDVTGILGEKLIANICKDKNIDLLKVEIQLPDDHAMLDMLIQSTQSALRTIQYSDTRIHIMITSRPQQVVILNTIRNAGLFQKNHVWLAPIDLSDSISLLDNPSDFNGLIMADVMWEIPGNPAYDNFITEWISLNPEQYPLSGSTQLTWHQTFAYTCLQVMVEGYAVLVQNANKIANETERQMLLREIRRGRRSQDLTLPFLGARTYNSPTGNFTLGEDGNPAKVQVGIFSFQNHSSVFNGKVENEYVNIFNPVQFKGGSTRIPRDSPSADELYPQSSSPFGVTMIILTSILFLAIISTAVIVIVNRDNIIIKSASPLFCVLELIGLSLTLSWIYLRADVPPPGICRIGMMVVMIGLTINLSALVVKNYRIYRIFNSVSIINHAVSNKYLLRVVAIPVIITLIPCIIHCFVHYLEPDLIRTNNDQFWVQCSSDNSQYVWDIVIGATPLILTLFGVYLAFKTRNVTRLWNEARAIATTIYFVTFFIIIIIIVQTFPQSLYQVSYHVTVVCVFVASFVEYCILFVPKLRNLWLQKRGLHVRIGRDRDMMDSVLGGINANVGRRGGVSNASHADDAAQDYLAGDREKRHGSTAGVVSERRSSDTSDAQPNMNISDLVSSYPFGQINNDVGSSSVTSPVHRPTIYGHSNLSNRYRKTMGTQESNIDSLDLSEPTHPLSKRPSLAAGGSTSVMDGNQGANSQAKNGGYGIFGGNPLNTARSSRDAQSLDLHEILLASSNNHTSGEHAVGRRTSGMLTVNSCSSGTMDFLADPDRDMYSRKSSFGDFDHSGPGRTRSGTFTGAPVAGSRSRSPKLYPLHPQATLNAGHSSMKSGIRETRMDSYTVIVPVQRQRWYIMKVLAQWRMSKIIFVPYSKVLVIVDLETEKSSSLILHSIEAGYSSTEDQISEIPSGGQSIRPANLEPTRSHRPTLLARNASDQSARTIQFSHQVVPAVHSSPMSTEMRLGTTTESAAEQQVVQDFLKTPSNSTAVHSSSLPVTASGVEPLEARPSLRRRASQQMISNVKNMAHNFGLDMRQMDGATRTFEDSLAGIEEGIQTDYIIRVISIHNECWRIQLPDQETMDRWVEIGQQIKDDNWIARPINGGRGSVSTKRDPSDGPSSGGTEEDGGSALDRSHMVQSRNHSRTFHPLQHHDGDNGPGSNPRLQRDERGLSDLTDSSGTSNETERQIIRERAARMNQQLRANNKFPTLSLRGLRPESVRSGSSGPTLELSQGISGSDSTVSKRPKKLPAQSSLSRIVTLPSPSNDLDGADAGATVALSEPSTAVPGGPHHQLNSDDLDSSLITRRRTEEADLCEILAETNIAYRQGQHAVYEGDDPAMAHRSHRFFNNLQYNYNRRRLQDEEVPQSPEWHLTSVELAQMESERTLSGGDLDLPSNDSTRLSVAGIAQQQPVMGQALTSPMPIVSVTAPPKTLTSPWSILSSPSQGSREAVPPMAPPVERFVSMSPMVMHLPPTFPKFSPPGEGGVAISEEERTNGLFEDSRTPQLLDHHASEDQAIAGPMPPTLENNSDTGRAGQ